MSRRLNNKDNSILSQKMVIMNHESGRKAIDQISKLLGGCRDKEAASSVMEKYSRSFRHD